ncbi:bifunctional DNA-formamidopyrimidine glycosylase/DNA-(apurinic or apyrimidinic site) lyase [Desulfovibrio mangrovi]|uniref:bifunctional DNA-formamidopyrimidine glycosylase/DNA-(apurinic or apyrimidinic site) lyase n=1 Tax=Desulfovibrio mangrovi TaxID=2976983 RepID=UPI00224709E9|nr:bifunctional DNA-formamidopyrimidine glycosylase/DNA-(apurinic or apyrimidinic site) lyase [Desulfovibrio mangrovi]UZP66969.1 bifunctional DNA-formamidopyrimidine glycosylase/DNA-(apurinic or apyrimidinic site) lyase [Desulfovibrio mangrovi]
MPELPEVETIARGLAPQVEQRTIAAVHILNDSTVAGRRNLLEHRVAGCVVRRVHRRGKVLLMDLEGASKGTAAEQPTTLAFHLKMSGRLFVYPQGKPPATHTRLIFDLSDGSRLFFDDTRKFGYCRALAEQDFSDWDFWQKLGPEPLDISECDFVQLLRDRRTRIKAALLDQTVIAGIGNIYADESLFRARIRPDTACNSVPEAKLRTLHGVIQAVLQQAIRECGSSIRDYRDAHGDAGAFQNSFLVYGKAGEKCTVCGKKLSTAKVAGRTTVFCGKCQK